MTVVMLTYEEIQAALTTARDLRVAVYDPRVEGPPTDVSATVMEQLLTAAYTRRAAGDSVLSDLQTRIESAEQELSRIQAQGTKARGDLERLRAERREELDLVEVREAVQELLARTGDAWWLKIAEAHARLARWLEDE